MAFFKLLPCCGVRCGRAPRLSEKLLAADPDNYTTYKDHRTKAELADEIVAKLLRADRNDVALKAELQSTIHTFGWYDGLAAAVLSKLEDAIRLGKEMGPAIKSAYEKATAEIRKIPEWAEEHPVLAAVVVTLVALGILAIMTPWLLAWLGFAEEGIVEGSWAAIWQSTYKGFVPKNSLFSYLQSLGTKIGRKWLV